MTPRHALWRLAGAYTAEPQDREDLYQEILLEVCQSEEVPGEVEAGACL